MTTHSFILRLDRDPNPYADELYEAGLDDATIGSAAGGEGVAYFDREAPTWDEAVILAIADVHKTAVRVIGLDADADTDPVPDPDPDEAKPVHDLPQACIMGHC